VSALGCDTVSGNIIDDEGVDVGVVGDDSISGCDGGGGE